MTNSKRPGPGRRPKAPDDPHARVMVSMKLPRWLVKWLREHPGSQSRTVEAALCKVHDLKAPGGYSN